MANTCKLYNRPCDFTACITTTQFGITYCKYGDCPVRAERKRKRSDRIAKKLSSMTEYEKQYFLKHYRY